MKLTCIHSDIFTTIIEEQCYPNKDDENELNVLQLVIMQIAHITTSGM